MAKSKSSRSKNSILKLVFGDGDWKHEGTAGKYALAVLLVPVVVPFHFLLFLMFSWSISRRARSFIYGIPAVITVFCMILALILFSLYKDKVRNRYSGAFAVAFEEEQYEDARLFNVKARTLDPVNASLRIQAAELMTAEATTAEDGMKAALPMMEDLARLDDVQTNEEGEPVVLEEASLEAHMWCAKVLLNKDVDLSRTEEERHQLAKRHLEIVTQGLEAEDYQVKLFSAGEKQSLDSEGQRVRRLFIESHYFLGGEYDRENDTDKAIDHYALASSKAPTLFPLVLEKMKEKLGAESRGFAAMCARAKNQLSSVALANPNSISVWDALIKCYELQGQYREGEKQIEYAQKMVTNVRVARQLRQIQSNLYINEIKDSKPTGSAEQIFLTKIQLLTESLRIMPQNPEAIKQMIQMVYKPDGPLTEEQTDWLRLVALNGETKFVAYTMLGLSSAVDVSRTSNLISKEEAIVQWSHAKTENPGTIDVINFAAQLIGVNPDDENGIDTAMAIMDLSLTMSPAEPKFLETRGLLMLKEENLEAAYEDLHTAYEILGNNQSPTLLQALIECVEKMGDGKEDELKVFKQRFEILKKQFEEQRRLSRSAA